MTIIYSASAATTNKYPSFRFLDGTINCTFADLHSLLTYDDPGFGPGTSWVSGDFRYREASPFAVDHDLLTTGGLKLYIDHKRVSPKAFGAIGNGVVDDTIAVHAWTEYLRRNTHNPDVTAIIDGHFVVSEVIDLTGIFRPILGQGQSTCGFTQTTDNIGIIKIGGIPDMGHPNYGWHGSDFFCRYQTVQPAQNTDAIAIRCQYFSYSRLERFHIWGACRGFASLSDPEDNACFSSTISDGKINRCSFRYFEISSGISRGNTGNAISNIYCSGQRADVNAATCETVFLFERMSEGSIGQLNAEWLKANRVLVTTRCAAFFGSIHLEGIAARTLTSGLFYFLGSQVTIAGVTFKTVNFSGGDPETREVGPLTNSSLFEVGVEDQGGATRLVILSGRSANCVAATENLRTARSWQGWELPGMTIEVHAWEDLDGILTNSFGEPNTEFLGRPTTAHMPILKRWNDLYLRPFVRGRDPGSNADGLVAWTPLENAHSCYSTETRTFKAPTTSHYQVSYTVELAADSYTELRVYNTAGVERTAHRARFGTSASAGSPRYSTGSKVLYLQEGESFGIYTLSATTASQFSLLDVALIR